MQVTDQPGQLVRAFLSPAHLRAAALVRFVSAITWYWRQAQLWPPSTLCALEACAASERKEICRGGHHRQWRNIAVHG